MAHYEYVLHFSPEEPSELHDECVIQESFSMRHVHLSTGNFEVVGVSSSQGRARLIAYAWAMRLGYGKRLRGWACLFNLGDFFGQNRPEWVLEWERLVFVPSRVVTIMTFG